MCSRTIRTSYLLKFCLKVVYIRTSLAFLVDIYLEEPHKIFIPLLLKKGHFNIWFCLLFTLHHNFWVCNNILDLTGNSFLKVRVDTSLFPDYILDDTLDNDTPNGCNGISDNIDEKHDHDNIENNNVNLYNNNCDDNDSNFDNVNGDQTIMMFRQ